MSDSKCRVRDMDYHFFSKTSYLFARLRQLQNLHSTNVSENIISIYTVKTAYFVVKYVIYYVMNWLICSKQTFIGRCQAIIWTNAGILSIRTLRTNVNEIEIEIHTFSFQKPNLKISSAKWWPFCLGLNMLTFTVYHGKVCCESINISNFPWLSPFHSDALCDNYITTPNERSIFMDLQSSPHVFLYE